MTCPDAAFMTQSAAFLYEIADESLKKTPEPSLRLPTCHSGRSPTWRSAWTIFGPGKNHRTEFRSRPGIHAGMGNRSRKFMRHIVRGHGFRVGLYGEHFKFARYPSAQGLPKGPRTPGMTRAETSSNIFHASLRAVTSKGWPMAAIQTGPDGRLSSCVPGSAG